MKELELHPYDDLTLAIGVVEKALVAAGNRVPARVPLLDGALLAFDCPSDQDGWGLYVVIAEGALVNKEVQQRLTQAPINYRLAVLDKIQPLIEAIGDARAGRLEKARNGAQALRELAEQLRAFDGMDPEGDLDEFSIKPVLVSGRCVRSQLRPGAAIWKFKNGRPVWWHAVKEEWESAHTNASFHGHANFHEYVQRHKPFRVVPAPDNQ